MTGSSVESPRIDDENMGDKKARVTSLSRTVANSCGDDTIALGQTICPGDVGRDLRLLIPRHDE